MNHSARGLTILLLAMTIFMAPLNVPHNAQGQSTQPLPLVNVWSDACKSSNITITNSACGSLIPGGSFQVEINVTNAPSFNAYEFFLYYDSNYINATSFDLFTGTVFGSGLPSNDAPNPLRPPGTVRLAVVNNFNPPSYTGHNGTLAHITFNILKVGVSPLVLAAGVASASGGGTELVSNVTPILVTTSDGYFSTEPPKRITFVDSPPGPAPNSPGTWSPGKAVIYDADNTGTFTAGDVVMNGAAPSVGTNLSIDYKIKFVDSPPAPAPNSLGTWLSGDTIVYDRDVSGTYTTGIVPDIVIGGATPAPNTNLSIDSDTGPVARFTYTPAAPRQGDMVTFNATSSFDPDGGLFHSYRWDFGIGGSGVTSQNAIDKVALSAGNFSIRLTVTDDDDGFTGMQVQLLKVAPENLHDLALVTFAGTPLQASPGDIVAIRADVLNAGSFSETYNLTVSYGQPSVLIGSKGNQNITSGASSTFSFNWNTTGLSPGFYTVRGLISVAQDNNTANNAQTLTVRILGPTSPISNTPLLLAVAAIAIIAAVSATIMLLRRRRRGRDAD